MAPGDPKLEGQGLAVLDLDCKEEPSTLMVGVCCSLGVTSLLRPSALIVSLCRRTEEDLRSAWLALGLTLVVFTASRVSTLLLLSLLSLISSCCSRLTGPPSPQSSKISKMESRKTE